MTEELSPAANKKAVMFVALSGPLLVMEMGQLGVNVLNEHVEEVVMVADVAALMVISTALLAVVLLP